MNKAFLSFFTGEFSSFDQISAKIKIQRNDPTSTSAITLRIASPNIKNFLSLVELPNVTIAEKFTREEVTWKIIANES